MFNSATKSGLRSGNPTAYREVFRLLYPRLKGYCKLFIAEESDVEDIIQDTFVALWEKRNVIKSDKKIESLIFVMIRNRCLNYLKSQKIASERISLDKVGFSELQYLYQLDFTEREEKSVEEMLISSFQNAVKNLPDKMQKVFVQCKMEGRRQKEVADELGISIKMVEKYIARAKNELGEQLRKQYPTMLLMIGVLLN